MGLTWDHFKILQKRLTNYHKQVALSRQPGWNLHVFISLQLKIDHTTLWLNAWLAFFLYCEQIESVLLKQKTKLKQNMVSLVKSLIFGLVILSLEEFKARIPVERVIQRMKVFSPTAWPSFSAVSLASEARLAGISLSATTFNVTHDIGITSFTIFFFSAGILN